MDTITFDAATTFVYGLIAVLVLAIIVLSFYSKIKTLKKETDEKIEKAKSDAAIKAREETRSEMAFNDLKKAVEKVNENVTKFNDKLESVARNLGVRVEDLEKCITKVQSNLVVVKRESRAANRRIDEHKKVDHGFDHVEHREYNDEQETEWED